MTPPDMIWSQMQSIADDLAIKAAKTGMLGNAETVALVAKGLQNFDFGKYGRSGNGCERWRKAA